MYDSRYNVNVMAPWTLSDEKRKAILDAATSELGRDDPEIVELSDRFRFLAVHEVTMEAIIDGLKQNGFGNVEVTSERFGVPLCPICGGDIGLWFDGRLHSAGCELCRRTTMSGYKTTEEAVRAYMDQAERYLEMLEDRKEYDYDSEYDCDDDEEEDEEDE